MISYSLKELMYKPLVFNSSARIEIDRIERYHMRQLSSKLMELLSGSTQVPARP